MRMLYKFLLIFFLFIFLFLVLLLIILILRKKFSIAKLAKYLLLPRPIVGYSLLCILASVANHQTLKCLIDLRKAIEKRFTSIYEVPILLSIDSDYRLSNPFLIEKSSENIHWFLTNKYALVQIKFEHFEETLYSLFDVFDAQACDSILFNIQSEDEENFKKINELMIFHKNLTKDEINIFIIHQLNTLNHMSVENLNHENSLGYNCKKENIENFIQKLEKQFLAIQHADYFLSALMSYFLKNQSFWQNLCIEFKKYNLCGIYFTLKNLNNQNLFLEDFLGNIVCQECAYNIFFNNHNNSRKKTIERLVNFFLILFLVICGSMLINNLNHNYTNLSELTDQSKMLNRDKIIKPEHLKFLGLKNFSPLTRLLMKKEMDQLKKIRNQYLYKNTNILEEKKENIFLNEIFSLSPIYTNAFEAMETNIENSCKEFKEFYAFIKKENISGSFDTQLENNEKKIMNEILYDFNLFFQQFDKCIVLRKMQALNTALNTIIYNNTSSLNDIQKVIELIEELKLACHIDNNYWWIFNNLGNKYNDLMFVIKKTPKVGHNIYEQIEEQKNLNIQLIKDKILKESHMLCGNFCNLKKESLELSDKLIQLYNFLLNIINEPMLKINYDFVHLSICQNNQICLFDIDLLDKTLNYLNERSNFQKNIANCHNQIKYTLQSLADDNMKKYILLSIKESQTIINNKVSLEELSQNFNEAYKRINKIIAFCKINLNYYPNELDNIMKDISKKLTAKIKEELENSILTIYQNINQWKGNNSIIEFLFHCSVEEFAEKITNGLQVLRNVYNNTLIYLGDKKNLFNTNDWNFIEHVTTEISSYINGKSNRISQIESLLLGLKDWETKWRAPTKMQSLNFKFFDLCYRKLEHELINQTNAVFMEKSNHKFTEIKNYFNQKIKNRFPFGDGDTVEPQVLINFLELYKKNRAFLSIEDPKLKHKIEILDSFLNFFDISGNHLFMTFNIEYHYQNKGCKNNNLVLSYTSEYGNQKFKQDKVFVKTKVLDSYELSISFASSSLMHLNNSVVGKVKRNTITYSFSEIFSFLKFLDLNFYHRTKDGIIIKLVIDIEDNKGNPDEVILFIKVKNLPIFIREL